MKWTTLFARDNPALVVSLLVLFVLIFSFVYSGCEKLTSPQNSELSIGKLLPLSGRDYSNPQPFYKTYFPNGYFSKLDNEAAVHNRMLKFLDVVDPRRVLSSVKEADLSDAVIVSAIDISHYNDSVYMCRTMAAYKKFGSRFERRLIIFLLGEITESYLKIFVTNCSFVEFRLFPYHLFPAKFRYLHHYRFKPAVIALMLKEYSVVYWLDSSIRFVASNNTTFEDYFSVLKKRGVPFAMSSTAGHSILATTEPTMYQYLPIEDGRKEVDVGLSGMMLFIGTREVKSTVLLRFLQCAFVPDCMAPPGHSSLCVFKDRFKDYAGCHRYDQSAVNIIANLYTNNNMTRYIVPFDGLSVRRHVP